jgi:hypothetical protein
MPNVPNPAFSLGLIELFGWPPHIPAHTHAAPRPRPGNFIVRLPAISPFVYQEVRKLALAAHCARSAAGV